MNELDSFEEVYERYQPLLYGTLKRYAIYAHQEDMLQEARLALWEAYSRFKPERGDFSAYAAKYVRGRVLRLLRKVKRHEECYIFSQLSPQDEEADMEPEWEDHRAEAAYLDCEWKELLTAACQELSAREKLVLKEHFLLERPLKELAEREQVSLETVKTWRKRALKKLRHHLSPLLKEKGI